MFAKQDVEMIRRDGLYLKDIPSKGRGLFCKEDIKAGEVIEVTPLYVFNGSKHYAEIEELGLGDYVFGANNVSRNIKALMKAKSEEQLCGMPLGVALFCNHSSKPNAATRLINKRYTSYFQLEAKEDIVKNTEICISYGKSWFLHRKF